ncbi:hypothetical protein DSO57_1032863 [Entomophthora muscae]|uniref:Uncharacterized protein n=1 Tax=Entomophthora muscae TaxID=34485 RepID=A0ACC2T0B0_9FUNG|nr:hypothetical protein DSO57_1032863 [Entomophthora muscae]
MKLFVLALVSLVVDSVQGVNIEDFPSESIEGDLHIDDQDYYLSYYSYISEKDWHSVNIYYYYVEFDENFPNEYTPAIKPFKRLLDNSIANGNPYVVIYINAENHEIQEQGDPLIPYIKNNIFPSYVRIRLPYISNSQVLEDLMKAAKEKNLDIEIFLKDNIPLQTLKKLTGVVFRSYDKEYVKAAQDEGIPLYLKEKEVIAILSHEESSMVEPTTYNIMAQGKTILSDIKLEKNDFITVDLFNDMHGANDNNGFTVIKDCNDGSCLLDRDELEETNVYIGLVFDPDFSMKYPPTPDVFESFLTSHNENKRPYTGIHIQAEDYPILEHTSPLIDYVNNVTVGQGNGFPKNSLITLPYTPDSQVFDLLVKQAVEKFKIVFISLQDTQVPLRTLKKFTSAVFISSDSVYAEANSKNGIKMVHASFWTGEPGEAFSSTLDVCKTSRN